MKLIDLSGKRFGRLEVLHRASPSLKRVVFWHAICDCGKRVITRSRLLMSGATKSCGCLQRQRTSESHITHGHTRYSRWTPEYSMWSAAKGRAQKHKIDFSIRLSDVVIPQFCPLLGTEIFVGVGKWGPNSPSLDRINPTIGYVRGNVWVISHRANTIKNNASLEDLRLIVKGLERVQ